jgi:hypothetical protein
LLRILRLPKKKKLLRKKLKHLLPKQKLMHLQKLKAQSNFNKSLFNGEVTFLLRYFAIIVLEHL